MYLVVAEGGSSKNIYFCAVLHILFYSTQFAQLLGILWGPFQGEGWGMGWGGGLGFG